MLVSSCVVGDWRAFLKDPSKVRWDTALLGAVHPLELYWVAAEDINLSYNNKRISGT